MYPCLEQAIDGDANATKALVDSLRPRITRMAAYYARRTGEDPDDLLQEAWLGLLEALPELDLAIGAPSQHLVQRARWRLLDAVRRARLRRCVSLDAVGYEEHGHDRLTGFERVWMEEFTGGLKPYQRAVLGCLLRGLTWREAGSALGCTSANIAYHVRQIRREFEAYSESDVAPAPTAAGS